MFDFTDHQIAAISMWIEVGILTFMVWEHYGPTWGTIHLSPRAIKWTRGGIGHFLWENRTLIVAVVGLGFVAWLNLGRPTSFSIANFWLWIAIMVILLAISTILAVGFTRRSVSAQPTRTIAYTCQIVCSAEQLASNFRLDIAFLVVNSSGEHISVMGIDGNILYVNQQTRLPAPSVVDAPKNITANTEFGIAIAQWLPKNIAADIENVFATGERAQFNLTSLNIYLARSSGGGNERLSIWDGVTFRKANTLVASKVVYVGSNLGTKTGMGT